MSVPSPSPSFAPLAPSPNLIISLVRIGAAFHVPSSGRRGGHSGAIIGGRGYFSSGGDFDLKTTFYGLVLLYMTERQLPEVSADIKTISVRPEIRSGRPFKVYAHYLFLSTV